jgi:hypothetical protein
MIWKRHSLTAVLSLSKDFFACAALHKEERSFDRLRTADARRAEQQSC